MSKKKIEKPEADEYLRHGSDGFREAKEAGLEAHQPHLDNTDMDASWRLRQDRTAENLAEGTYSEGLSRVAQKERREQGLFARAFRKVNAEIGDLSEQEMWEVLRYGDTVDELEATGKMTAEDAASDRREFMVLKEKAGKAEKKSEAQLEAQERERLDELKKKYEDKEAMERAELARLKAKYEGETK